MQPTPDAPLPAQAQVATELQALQVAQQELAMGNHAQAELYLRRHIAALGSDALTDTLLGSIARGYGVTTGFRLSETHTPPEGQRPRYLLIKAWGFGFWSDVHHVLGQLLLAELTQRIPVVHWGSNSLFGDGDDWHNAYTQFFEPPSSVQLKDLCAEGLSIYPPKWNRSNLQQNNVNKFQGAYSRLASQYLFRRDEDVLVNDYYMPVAALLPWLAPDSRYFGHSDNAIYADLFARHIRPQAHILQQVQSYYEAHMQGRAWVAVHARGSDKALESLGLAEINLSYFGFVDRILQLNPGIGVFLLTDSVDIHATYAERYGQQLLTTPVLRSENAVGVHYQEHSGLQLGTEVLTDALLAVQCNYFVGNGESNVSLAISNLKPWSAGMLAMLGIPNFRGEGTMLYARAQAAEPWCRLCSGNTRLAFRKQVMGQHNVGYYRCEQCFSLQTEAPYWIEQADAGDPERYDTGKASRTLANFMLLPELLQILQVSKSDVALDFGGRTGLFGRLMRDIGFNFFTHDKFGSNEFMGGYTWNSLNLPCKLITLFQVAEHFTDPVQEWKQLLACNPQWIIGSTELYADQSSDWHHLNPLSGQHVFFYSREALALIARESGRYYYQLGLYFLITRLPLEAAMIEQINAWQQQLYPACKRSFDNWIQGPYINAALDHAEVSVYSHLRHSNLKIVIDGVFFRFNSGIARVWKRMLAQWALTELAGCLVVVDRKHTAPRYPGIHYIDAPHFDFGDASAEADRRMLQDICDRENASLFVSTYYSTPLTTRSILLVHDMIPEVEAYDLQQAQWVSKQRAIDYARAFVCVSHSTRRDLVRVHPQLADVPMTVAHCGCDFRTASAAQIAAFRQRAGITRPYFLLVGEMRWTKNAELFFKAFACLGALRSELAIVCTLADGALDADFSQHVGDAHTHMVVLTDDEMQAAYSGAIALAYPSRYEGFGLPVLEAMACSCPVITCRNSSIPEVGGEAVIYVDPDSVEQMHQALLDVQQPDVRQRLIAQGLTQAQQFSWTGMAREVGARMAQWALNP
jgi:glycosyltransferase involved in cell wall biosynthesis